jgi:hypothetical protein
VCGFGVFFFLVFFSLPIHVYYLSGVIQRFRDTCSFGMDEIGSYQMRSNYIVKQYTVIWDVIMYILTDVY